MFYQHHHFALVIDPHLLRGERGERGEGRGERGGKEMGRGRKREDGREESRKGDIHEHGLGSQ